MNFVVDILACVAFAMGATALTLMAGRFSPAKRVGIILSTSIGGWCVAVLIIIGVAVWNSRG